MESRGSRIYRNGSAVTCPWEVWRDGDFVAAYQTEHEARRRMTDEAPTWAEVFGAIPDTSGQTALWIEHQAPAPTLADVEKAARLEADRRNA